MDQSSYLKFSQFTHWIDDHVRFSDLDPLGHVNNNAIGSYFENARAALFREVTPNWPHRDELFVLARMTIDFKRELHMPAQLKIGTAVLKIGRTSMTLANGLFRGEEGIAYGESVSVLINEKSRKPVEISAELRGLIGKYMVK